MGKIFNVTADCKPGLHYMVDISSRLARMKGYVDRGEYFTINQHGLSGADELRKVPQ